LSLSGNSNRRCSGGMIVTHHSTMR
jgi:hypothetical protein